MSDILCGPMREGWESETLADTAAQAFYEASLRKHEASEKDVRTFARHAIVAAAAGMAIGVLGIVSGLVLYCKTPAIEPPRYILVHETGGHIDEPVTAVNAPSIFPESTRESALRDLIVACEGYVPQTWVKLDYHACMIRLSASEQKRREAEIGLKNSPRYPPALFGPAGWAMPSAITGITKLGETGSSSSPTYSYQVRYVRTEVVNNKENYVHWTALITCQFHPELRMSPADRMINEPGLQALSFSTTRD